MVSLCRPVAPGLNLETAHWHILGYALILRSLFFILNTDIVRCLPLFGRDCYMSGT